MQATRLGLILTVFVSFSTPARLPTYLTQCSERDPNFDSCYLRSANLGIPHIVKGDPQYKIPVMAPYHLDGVTVRNDKTLQFYMTNVNVYGLENMRVTIAKFDLNNLKFYLRFQNPLLTILGNYKISGDIAGARVHGFGPGNITLVNGTYDTNVNISMENDGYETFIMIKNVTSAVWTEQVVYNLQTPYDDFNATPNLSGFMNQHWKEIASEYRWVIEKMFSNLIFIVMDAISTQVPINEKFKP